MRDKQGAQEDLTSHGLAFKRKQLQVRVRRDGGKEGAEGAEGWMAGVGESGARARRRGGERLWNALAPSSMGTVHGTRPAAPFALRFLDSGFVTEMQTSNAMQCHAIPSGHADGRRRRRRGGALAAVWHADVHVQRPRQRAVRRGQLRRTHAVHLRARARGGVPVQR